MSNRADDAARWSRAVASNPTDRISWHNLAAAEGDLGRVAEGEAAARRAIALGIAAPETRLVLARALQGLRRLDEAEAAFEEAIALRPAYVEAHRDLAQLAWMRTGDAHAALLRLDIAIARTPRESGLHLVRSVVLEFSGDRARALLAVEAGLAQMPDDTALLRQAAHLCVDTGDTPRALLFAQQAAQLAPAGSAPELTTLCEALIAAGRVLEADAAAEALVTAQPGNQYALALQSTTWRLKGDRRYASLYDYGSLVGSYKLDTPAGFDTLEAFLRALATELEALHGFRAHPLQQSVRGGSQLHLQAPELARPLINALFQTINAAVQRHIAELGMGRDVLRARNTGRFGFSGAWSVRLQSGGHHADHVHPHGWISSACYIALPASVGRNPNDRTGWLRLGKPAVPTIPVLEADHYVRPEPGLLVLFPAYMWHGVEPFEDESPRLSVAFDVVPA